MPHSKRSGSRPMAAVLLLGLLLPSCRRLPADRTIRRIAISASGEWLAAGTASGHIAIWKRDAAAPAATHRFDNGPLNDLQFTPDGRWVAIANRGLTLVSLDPVVPTRTLRDDDRNYGSIRFPADGQRAATITGAGVIETISTATGASLTTACCSSIAGELDFTADGALLVTAGHLPRLSDARSGTLIAALTGERQFMLLGPIAFLSGDLLIGSQDGRIRRWDVSTRRLVATSPASPDWAETIAVHPQTGLVAFAAHGHLVRLWDPRTNLLTSIAGLRTSSNLVFTPVDHLLAVGAAGAIEFWDTQTAVRRRTLHFPPIE